MAAYRNIFQRADQVLRFRAYLRGLLQPGERKNIESIAAAASKAMMVEANLGQALHHFVSQSPWNSQRLMNAVCLQSRERRQDPDAVWVVHDAIFPKKGLHSVGVMRQFARDIEKKINCQVAVFIAQVGPRGYFPLAARLYLPASWLRVHAAKVPPEFRDFAGKGAIAWSLLQNLLEIGETPRPLALETTYANDSDLIDRLNEQNLQHTANTETHDHWRPGLSYMKRELGLEHFEGRTWQGWHHHVSLVFAAYDLLAAEATHLQPDLITT